LAISFYKYTDIHIYIYVLISIWVSVYIEDVGKDVVIVVSSQCVSLYVFCYPYEVFYIRGIVICFCDLYIGLCIHTEDLEKYVFIVVSCK